MEAVAITTCLLDRGYTSWLISKEKKLAVIGWERFYSAEVKMEKKKLCGTGVLTFANAYCKEYNKVINIIRKKKTSCIH